MQSYAELRYPQLACEVFLEHGSDPALLFHGSFGFREVGQHVMPGRRRAVRLRASMLMKELCSYAWVREHYGDDLPDAPWLPQPRTAGHRAPRDRHLSMAAPSASTAFDYEQAGELKIGQVGIANLRVRTLDVAQARRRKCANASRARRNCSSAPR